MEMKAIESLQLCDVLIWFITVSLGKMC